MILKKKAARIVNTTNTAVFHPIMMKTAKKTIQKTGLNTKKRNTKEADEHMLTVLRAPS